MAISLGRYNIAGAKIDEAERQKKIFEAQQSRARSRKGMSGLLGTVLGGLAGAALNFIIPGGGLLMKGLLTGAGKFLGKKAGHELTSGMASDPSKMKAEGKYGFGRASAKTLRSELEKGRAEDPFSIQGGLGAEMLGGVMKVGMAEGWDKVAGSVGDMFKGDPMKKLAKSKLTPEEIAQSVTAPEGAMESLEMGETIGAAEDYLVDPDSISAQILEGTGDKSILDIPGIGGESSFDTSGVFPVEEAGSSMDILDFRRPESPDFSLPTEPAGTFRDYPVENIEGIDYYVNPSTGAPVASTPLEPYKQGGLVPTKAPTISDYFGMQGVSLGGSNKKSFAEILGRK